MFDEQVFENGKQSDEMLSIADPAYEKLYGTIPDIALSTYRYWEDLRNSER